MSTAEPKRERKPRAKRRNYQREVESLRTWCELSLDIYQRLAPVLPEQRQGFDARTEVIKEVLARLGGTE